MRPVVSVALAIICHRRPDELLEALASATDEGFDETIVLDMASEPPIPSPAGAVLVRSDSNLGYPWGRNLLVRQAASDVIFFLDDDAVIKVGGFYKRVAALFEDHPRLGAVACQVTRSDGHIEPSEWPFRGPPRAGRESCLSAYFVGAGHAVRRSAWQAVGGIDESFIYSTEEIDLSMALMRDGWEIRYEPDLIVEHHPSPRGRSVRPQIPALRLRNRIIYARRHLPWAIAIVHITLWVIRTGGEAIRAHTFRNWLSALPAGLRAPAQRRPLGWSQLRRIHRLGGRVWW